MPKPVIVGVDGSDQALAAAHYAAGLARRRGVQLHLIYVFESLFYGFGPMYLAGAYAGADDQLRQAANTVLDEAKSRIREAHPEVEVQAVLREGGAASALIAASQEAAVTVVGSRGLGGFAELMLGSVSAQVAAHATGTVVVFRPQPVSNGPVVVGYDGSEAAIAALDYAVDEALSLDVPLIVTNAYWPEPWGFGDPPEVDPSVTAAHQAEALVATAVAPYRDKNPRLRVETRTVHSLNAEHTLVDESQHAGLTVVGSRGRGGFKGLLLGSVSQSLVHHAVGPVAVVHKK